MRSSADRPGSTRRARRGFSLAECLLAVAIAAVGILMIFQIYPMGFAASNRSQAKAVATAIASEILAVYRGELQRGPVSEHWATGLTLRNPLGCSALRQVSQGVNGQTAFNFPTMVSTGWSLGMFYWKAMMEEVASPYGAVTDRTVFAPMINSPLQTASQSPASDIDMVGARRVTVFVRGPFTDATTAGNYNPTRGTLTVGGGEGRVSAAEVVLSTIITTSRVGSTFLVTTPRSSGGGWSVVPYYIEVDSADAFSVFDAGALNSANGGELQDTGSPPIDPTAPPPPSMAPVLQTTNPYPASGGVGVGGDYYGLDNIWIGPAPGDYSCGESNKIVGVERPTGADYYRLYLARRPRGYWNGSAYAQWPAYGGAIGTAYYPNINSTNYTQVRAYTKAWTN